MTSPWNLRPGSVNLTSGAEGDATEMPPETPFRLLICGNLSGNRANPVAFNQRKPIRIDRDNFDAVLAKLAPSVTLPNHANGADVSVAFRELDDFEPDRLFRSLPVFEELRTLQTQVGNPGTFQQAAAKIRTWATVPEPAPTAPPKQGASAADLLDELLAGNPALAVPGATEPGDWQQFLQKIAQPHLVEKSDPRQADYALVVEHAIGAQMRAILHHPAFQALEATWRSVFFLVQSLPTDETLQLFVWDASLDDLRADLGRDDPRDSVFVREIIERAVDKPWAAVISLETFGNGVADLEVLASMAMISARARTPILAGAAPALFGCPSLAVEPDPRAWKPDAAIAAAWDMIRGMDASRYLGLAAPRFLLRLPYGKDAKATESFAFEEMTEPEHEQYLWGSGAVLCGLWLAEAFAASGWQLNLDAGMEVTGLPIHVYHDQGEACVKPCAEVLLRESAFFALMERGLMVLISQRDRDGIRLQRFHSAAKENVPLAGRWA